MDAHITRLVSEGDYTGLINTSTESQRERAGIRENCFDKFFWGMGIDRCISNGFRERLSETCCNDVCETYRVRLADVQHKISATNHYLTKEHLYREELEIQMRIGIRNEKITGKKDIHMTTMKINYDRHCYNIINAENDLKVLTTQERQYSAIIRAYTYQKPIDSHTRGRIRDYERLNHKEDIYVERAKESIEKRYDQYISDNDGLLSKRILYTDNTLSNTGIDSVMESPSSMFLRSLEEEEASKNQKEVEDTRQVNVDVLNIKTERTVPLSTSTMIKPPKEVNEFERTKEIV